jgi:hypothetical protein
MIGELPRGLPGGKHRGQKAPLRLRSAQRDIERAIDRGVFREFFA